MRGFSEDGPDSGAPQHGPKAAARSIAQHDRAQLGLCGEPQARVYVCMCVCACVCESSYIHTYMHTYIHAYIQNTHTDIHSKTHPHRASSSAHGLG